LTGQKKVLNFHAFGNNTFLRRVIMYSYPIFSDATSAATLAYSILSGGELKTRTNELANAIWTVQGYAQSRLLPVSFGDVSDEDSASFDALAAAIAAELMVPVPMHAALEGRRDWSKLIDLIVKLAPVILPLII
jgi:hypothetical protein